MMTMRILFCKWRRAFGVTSFPAGMLAERSLCLPFLFFCLFVVSAEGRAEGGWELPAGVAQLSDSLKRQYAPDARVALFEVDYACAGTCVMVRGVTTSLEAKTALLNGLKARHYEVTDCLKLLPDSVALDGKTYGVVNLSVCNLHARPDFASEMVTQGLLGMPVRVLQQDGWFRIQTPDRYIAWVHRAGIRLMTRAELAAWNRAEKLVVTASYGTVYDRPQRDAQPVSDVVSGDRLKWEGQKGAYYAVSYPDGRKGYLHKSLGMPEHRWRSALEQTPAAVLQTARSLMGVPYLWAGMSSKGMDCSGVVRTVLYLHDILMPRDASQQAYVGERIEIAPDRSNLQAGDLLFFGSRKAAGRKERIVHVGIYIGDHRFIHSQGDVHVSSLDPADELFDAFNLDRLLFATRVFPYINKVEEIVTTDRHPLYND